MNLDTLNARYQPRSVEARFQAIYQDFALEKVLVTSSFGTSSAVLLHYLAQANRRQPVHFIDTTFHFEETLAYCRRLSEYFGLEVVPLKPDPHLNAYARRQELWRTKPDLCCTINKVQPVESILPEYDVWISGVMGYHSPERSRWRVFEHDAKNVLKCYPLIDLDRETVRSLYARHDWPRHPLEKRGYGSIGCTHCTVKGEGRQGRWPDSSKLECGLHFPTR
jgi:phosphoadenosine phosphosulfate reductase